MASAGKGLPFIGKMNEFLDKVLHPTVQKVGNSRAAVDVIGRGYYILNPVPTTPYTAELGSDDNTVVLTAHGAKPGDIIRLTNTANNIAEFEVSIDEIVDANTFKLAGYLSADLTAGDEFYLLRPISERLAPDGGTLASVAIPAVSYNRKAGGITAQTSVLEDLDTPSNSRALPVVLHGVDAASISITSGDLNISSSHANDSMRLGDGTTLVNATLANELKVSDADTHTNMGAQADAAATTDIGSFSIISFIKRGMQNWTSLLAKVPTLTLVGDALKVDGSAVTQPVSGTVTANAGTDLNTSNLALESTQTTHSGLFGALTETAPATDTASSGLNGRLQRIAQRITDLITLIPASLGQKNMAGSLAVTIASDQSDVPISNVGITNINTAIGAQADAVATTDTGTFSLISLIKKVAQNISNMALQLPASLGIKTAANSLSVAPASDAVFTTKPKAVTGSYAEITNLTTAAQTFTAPANAISAKIQTDDTNSANVRFKQGATATTTSGMQLQAGRAEDLGNGTDISVIAESGTNQKVYVIWNVQA